MASSSSTNDSTPHISPHNTTTSSSSTITTTTTTAAAADHTTPPSVSTTSTSLAAAAALNAGLQQEERRPSTGSLRGNPTYDRRRSSIRLNLALNDPSVPAPGEMVSPTLRHSSGWSTSQSPTRHARAPSLGELHQELENEQEAQVNRLLGQIRHQQAQIAALQSHHPAHTTNTTAIYDSATPSDTSRSQTPAQVTTASGPNTPRVPIPSSASRRSSARNSHAASPPFPAQPQHHFEDVPPPTFPTVPTSSTPLVSTALGPSASSLRDESAFYQAETQNLTRENQMLKHRIRELEKQLNDIGSSSTSPLVPHSPTTVSGLHNTEVAEENATGNDQGRQTEDTS